MRFAGCSSSEVSTSEWSFTASAAGAPATMICEQRFVSGRPCRELGVPTCAAHSTNNRRSGSSSEKKMAGDGHRRLRAMGARRGLRVLVVATSSSRTSQLPPRGPAIAHTRAAAQSVAEAPK